MFFFPTSRISETYLPLLLLVRLRNKVKNNLNAARGEEVEYLNDFEKKTRKKLPRANMLLQNNKPPINLPIAEQKSDCCIVEV